MVCDWVFVADDHVDFYGDAHVHFMMALKLLAASRRRLMLLSHRISRQYEHVFAHIRPCPQISLRIGYVDDLWYGESLESSVNYDGIKETASTVSYFGGCFYRYRTDCKA